MDYVKSKNDIIKAAREYTHNDYIININTIARNFNKPNRTEIDEQLAAIMIRSHVDSLHMCAGGAWRASLLNLELIIEHNILHREMKKKKENLHIK